MLEINVEAVDEGEGYHLCRLSGEVDAYTVGEFRETISEICLLYTSPSPRDRG